MSTQQLQMNVLWEHTQQPPLWATQIPTEYSVETRLCCVSACKLQSDRGLRSAAQHVTTEQPAKHTSSPHAHLRGGGSRCSTTSTEAAKSTPRSAPQPWDAAPPPPSLPHTSVLPLLL